MRKSLIDPSLNNEEQIKKLSKIVDRLGRRTHKQTSAIISPVPVSCCTVGEDVSGVILRYLFVCPGVINKGGIFLSKKPESGAIITLSIENELGGSRKSYTISRRNLIYEPQMKVDTWDRLSIMFQVVDSEKDKMIEVWTGFLWTPTIKDATIKSYLIDELENAED